MGTGILCLTKVKVSDKGWNKLINHRRGKCREHRKKKEAERL
jgi:hypothetical protein